MYAFRRSAPYIRVWLVCLAYATMQVGSLPPSCQSLVINQPLEIGWWDIKPYIYRTTEHPRLTDEIYRDKLFRETNTGHSPSSQVIQYTVGVFYNLLKTLNQSVNIKLSASPFKTYTQLWNASNWTKSGQPKTNAAYLPVMIRTNNKNPCKVKILESSGPAFIVRKNVQEPLKQLGLAMLNGGRLIGLVLLLTAISGICIWVLDRSSNPEDFPPSFIRGAWQGFWWAFVTMTTVGYGDTAPRSVPARIYSIFWMLLGMVAFSILTANITSSLTHELETDLNLFGKSVGVLNNSLDYHVALSQGAKSEEFPDVESMAQKLSAKAVEGILLDRHIAVSYNGLDKNNLVIGKLIDWSYYYGVHLHVLNNSCEAVSKCLESILGMEEFTRMMSIRDSVQIAGAVSSKAQSMFDDYRFFVILIALFCSLVGIGFLWSYFVYQPRLAQLQHAEADHDLDCIQTNKPQPALDKIVLLRTELDSMCEECKSTIESIAKAEGKERLEELTGTDYLAGTLAGISNQFNAIPGMASIKRIGGGLHVPTNVQSLRKMKRNIHAAPAVNENS